MTLAVETVLEAAAAWQWVPDDAVEHTGPDFRVVGYPLYFADPTVCFPPSSDRPAAELVDDVLAAARALGRDGVTFVGVNDATHPAGLEQHLLSRGAELSEELAVLALDLTDGVPELDPPLDVQVRRVDDLGSLRDFEVVGTTVFGGTLRSDEELANAVPGLVEEDGPRFVAYREGEATGAAGVTFAGDAARLWGAAVLPKWRHHGIYRALLHHRLVVGRSVGCRIALVKGRLDTSAPVLLRAGFRQYGQERSYRLAV